MNTQQQCHWNVVDGNLNRLYPAGLFLVLMLLSFFSFSNPIGGAAGQAIVIRLAYGKKIQYAPQIIAVQQNYFRDQGLTVKPQILATGPRLLKP